MKLLLSLLAFSFFAVLEAQVTKDYHFIEEYEFNLGYANLQGDMGKPSSYFSGFGSSGIVLGAKFYTYFSDPRDNTRSYLEKHLKYNFDTHFTYIKLVNKKGKGLSPVYASKINAIKGNLFMGNIGFNVEYHLTDLRFNLFFESKFFTHFDLYVSGGAFITLSNVNITSDLGDYTKDQTILPYSYKGYINNGNMINPGLRYGIGIRYKLNDQIQFSLSNNWSYFNSDYIDGINPNSKLVKNLHNDWMFRTNIGVIYFLTKEYN